MKLEDTTGIAIIGMAGRFPGSDNLEQFWENLSKGIESINFFSKEELIEAGVSPEMVDNPQYVKAKGVLDGAEMFDAEFFGYSPREAEIIDPQQRLFLECAWEALEVSGYNSDNALHRIGVYGGANISTYLINALMNNKEFVDSVGIMSMITGNDKDHLTTRTAYKMNLRGPSVTVSTACSTSLVAVHLGCQGLLNGECDIALAGGVCVSFPKVSGYIFQDGSIGSPDGHCRAFDEKAEGIVPGNGVGVIVLKRIDDAINDGDTIWAVIRGSAINNDGSQKVGYTAPSVNGQAEVIAETISMADIDAETISYIEAHGTGTSLGDPIEMQGLTKAFRLHTNKKGFCALGSVKTNIGHVGSAAGIAGLMKVVLALQHKQLPPSLNFQKPNTKIDFANSPFYINKNLIDWSTETGIRRAGVSSFGIGSANAHVILEEAPPYDENNFEQIHHLFIISSKTSEALDKIATNLIEYLKMNPDANLADVTYTLQVGRKHFDYRSTVLCCNREEAISGLESLKKKSKIDINNQINNRSVVFQISGQPYELSSVHNIYRDWIIFKKEFDNCLVELDEYQREKIEELFTKQNVNEMTQEDVESLGFIIDVALTNCWISLGIIPGNIICKDRGEFVAACISGVFTPREALYLLRCRLEKEKQPLSLDISLQQGAIPFNSSESGEWITFEQACNPYYWTEHTKWGKPLPKYELLNEESDSSVYLNIGNVDHLGLREEMTISVNNTPEQMLEIISRLWKLGFEIKWEELYPMTRKPRRIPLPTYPFNRKRYMIESKIQKHSVEAKVSAEDEKSNSPNYYTRPQLETEYVSPRNDIELMIADIWRNLLGIDEIGINDNFYELGGNSLLAIQFISRLRQGYPVEMDMRSLFEACTILQVAEIVELALIEALEKLE